MSCRECGRAAEEFSICPWCGALVPASRYMMWHCAAVSIVLVLGTMAFGLRERPLPALLYVVAAFSGFMLTAGGGYTDRRNAVLVSITAVAVSGLCHVLPYESVLAARRLRFHLGWVVPCATIALAASSIRLPPLPPGSRSLRLLAALKTPFAILLAGAALEVALLAPANAVAMVAVAVWCAFTVRNNIWTMLILVAAVLPAADFTEVGYVAGSFAFGTMVGGIIRS